MSGPGDAAGAELERIRAGVRIMAARALGDADAAEEASQETMVRLLRALSTGTSVGSSLGAYARGIALHVIADQRRSARRTIAHDPAILDLRSAALDDPLVRLEAAERQRAVDRAFAQLDAADQRLLRQCYYDGKTSAEVAADTGEPASRIRKRKSRAIERLRSAFFGESHDPASSPTVNSGQVAAAQRLSTGGAE